MKKFVPAKGNAEETRMMEKREAEQKAQAASKRVERAGKETVAHKVYGHLS